VKTTNDSKLYALDSKLDTILKTKNEPVVVVQPDRRYNKLYDPLDLPSRFDSSRLINIPTRGPPSEMQQVGILTNENNDKILPLYGRQTYTNSNKWNYYTSTDKFNQIKLPVNDLQNKNCTQEFGCTELSDGDSVNVPAYNDKFKVSIYTLDSPRYIPYI
jgi:hypothetical protein